MRARGLELPVVIQQFTAPLLLPRLLHWTGCMYSSIIVSMAMRRCVRCNFPCVCVQQSFWVEILNIAFVCGWSGCLTLVHLLLFYLQREQRATALTLQYLHPPPRVAAGRRGHPSPRLHLTAFPCGPSSSESRCFRPTPGMATWPLRICPRGFQQPAIIWAGMEASALGFGARLLRQDGSMQYTRAVLLAPLRQELRLDRLHIQPRPLQPCRDL